MKVGEESPAIEVEVIVGPPQPRTTEAPAPREVEAPVEAPAEEREKVEALA